VPVVVLAGVCASLFWFNRDARFDIWALYFFGSYGIGALAWWASEQQRRATRHMLLAAIVLPATCALLLYFRGRIALALFISCMMAWCARRDKPWRDALPPVSQWLGRIAYSVFLIHFPVCLVVNAAFTRYASPAPGWQGVGMLAAWAGSVLAGAAFLWLWLKRRWGACCFAPDA
jgi:peptidoglycan/LPS O-acetylase OafA/YrhL